MARNVDQGATGEDRATKRNETKHHWDGGNVSGDRCEKLYDSLPIIVGWHRR
jgi:hypothetical protein